MWCCSQEALQQQIDQKATERVNFLEKYLEGKHQDELKIEKERYASLEQKYQAEITQKRELEVQQADDQQNARNAVDKWSDFAQSVQAQLADAREQLQQQQGPDTSSHTHAALQEEQAATIYRLTSDNNSLKQEVQQLQQQAAVKAENTAAQQQLEAAQQQLVGLQSGIAEANRKTEESDMAGIELLRKAKQADQEAADAKEAFAEKDKQVNDFCRKILAQVQDDASQYAQDMKSKDEEIKKLKERISHRQSSHSGKRSRDDAHDRKESGRN